jgi:hypothetical protein
MSSSSTCLVMALYIPFNQIVLIEHKIHHPNHHPCCQMAEISADYQKRGRIKKQGESADKLHLNVGRLLRTGLGLNSKESTNAIKPIFQLEVTFRAPKTTFRTEKMAFQLKSYLFNVITIH